MKGASSLTYIKEVLQANGQISVVDELPGEDSEEGVQHPWGPLRSSPLLHRQQLLIILHQTKRHHCGVVGGGI